MSKTLKLIFRTGEKDVQANMDTTGMKNNPFRYHLTLALGTRSEYTTLKIKTP